MARSRNKLCCLLLAAVFLLSGCWDSREVSRLNLCTMIILDKMADTFTFTAEIAKITPAGESGSGGGTKQEYITGSGNTLPEARKDIDMQMDNPLYLATIRALVLTERVAQKDLAEYLFRLRENQSYRQKVYIVITKEEPQALTEFKNEADQPAGFVIDDTMRTSVSLGHSYVISSETYVNDILARRGFIVQHIGLNNKEIKLDGYSVFKNALLVGFIPEQETRGLTCFLALQPILVYRLNASGTDYTIEAAMTSKKIKPYYQDGRIAFRVQMACKGTIQYSNNVNLLPLNDQIKKELKESLTAAITQDLQTAVSQSRDQFQSDYLLLGEAFRIAYPDVYEKMDWNQEYPKADIQAAASVEIEVSEKMDYDPAS